MPLALVSEWARLNSTSEAVIYPLCILTPFLFSWQFLIAVLESNRAGPKAIHGLLATLFAARVLHGNFGMFWNSTALGNGRVIGFMTTNAVIAVAAIWNGVIGRQAYLDQL